MGKNGFSSSDLRAAQAGLDSLKNGQVSRTMVQLVFANGIPAICTVHAEATNPVTFKLFIAWRPTIDRYTGRSYYTAFGGVVGEKTRPHGLFLRTTLDRTTKIQWAKLEHAIAKGALDPPVISAGVAGPAHPAAPAEPCTILGNGNLALSSSVKRGWFSYNP